MAEFDAAGAEAGADFAAGAALGAGAAFAAGAAIVFAAGAALDPAIAESLFLLFFEEVPDDVLDDVLLEAASLEVEVFAAGAIVLVPEAAGAAIASVLAAAFFDFLDFLVVVVD
jgi:hypothetical protein